MRIALKFLFKSWFFWVCLSHKGYCVVGSFALHFIQFCSQIHWAPVSISACRLIPKTSLQSQALPELNRNILFCAYFQTAKLLLSKIKLKKVAEADVALQRLLKNLTHNHNVPLSSGAAKWDKPMSPRAAGEQQRCWAAEHSLQPPELLSCSATFLP